MAVTSPFSGDRAHSQPPQSAKRFRLFGASDGLYELLADQAALVHEGSVTYLRLLDGASSASGVKFSVDRIEADEERVYGEIEAILARALLLRVDREDLYRVATGLHSVRAWSTSSMRSIVAPPMSAPGEAMRELAVLLVDCTELVADAIGKLRRADYAAVPAIAREVYLRQRAATEIHHAELSSLLKSDDVDRAKELLRESFELRSIERTLWQCGSLGRLLVRLAVKNS